MTPKREELLFPVLQPHHIDCLARHAVELTFQDGEALFREGEQSEPFFVILEGSVRITHRVGGVDTFITQHGPGEFTGELAVLTNGLNLATGTAVGSVRTIKLGFTQFYDAIRPCPELMMIVVPALAQRRPEAMALQSQREKLTSLGTLAAGLAHELNNPASAAQRAASQLREELVCQQYEAIQLAELGLGAEHLCRLRTALEKTVSAPELDLDPLERSDRESALTDFLETHGVEDPWDVAADLATANLSVADVSELVSELPVAARRGALTWMSRSLGVESLVRTVEQSTERIRDLVGSIKSYSHLDRAPVDETDVRDGLLSTLKMLQFKLRKKSMEARTEFADNLPKITAFPAELNQVWTNLIDNAIDASSEGGALIVRALPDGPCIAVEIEDHGSGIPPDVLPRIFDPFFTTKGVGEGTGMGLDISFKVVVDRHHGDILVQSEPGRTVFRVLLPIQPAATQTTVAAAS